METVWHDVKHTARSLRRNPLFAATAILSLAVGIAGNTFIFSIADSLLLRPMPGIRNAGRLVDVGRTQDGSGFDNMSYLNYVDYRDRATVFDGLAGVRVGSDAFGLGSDGAAEQVLGTAVSENYFAVLEVPIALGRAFRAEEDRAGAPVPVTVISDALWRRQFNGDPNILGRSIRLNGKSVTIIGVAPPNFRGHNIAATELWIPLTLRSAIIDGDSRLLTMREGVWMVALGRLKSGVTLEQARAQMGQIARELEREYPVENRGHGVALTLWAPLPADTRGRAAGFIGVLFCLVSLILVTACTNVGGMLLARGVTRAREVAVRLALGAQGIRIVRLLITESTLLAIVGSVVGVAFTFALITASRRIIPMLPVPIVVDFRLDWRVVAFSIVLGMVATISCGLLPALEISRTDLVSSIKVDAASRGRRRSRLRQAFVIAQIAMSLLLVVAALLLARSLASANRINPGFVVDNVDVASIDMRLGGYDEARALLVVNELLARVEALPAVRSAALSRMVPLTGGGMALGPLRLPGQPSNERGIPADWNVISPGYFETLGISLVSGRPFTAADRAGTGDVAIVNESFARRVWPGENPIGRRLLNSRSGDSQRLLEIVGIARDAKYRTLGEDSRNFIYVPLAQNYNSRLSIMARADASIIPAIRTIVRQLDPNLPIIQAGSLGDLTAFGLVPLRAAGWIAGSVGMIGLLLAAIGVYGITSHGVTQRTREIGIRMALGALRGEVLRLVLRQAMMLAALGGLIGLAASALGSRLLRGLLYGIQPIDPVAFAGGALVLFTIAVLASLFPALRAARVDPTTALRAE